MVLAEGHLLAVPAELAKTDAPLHIYPPTCVRANLPFLEVALESEAESSPISHLLFLMCPTHP